MGGLKQCTVLELLPDDHVRLRVRYRGEPFHELVTYANLLRKPSGYEFSTKYAALKALVDECYRHKRYREQEAKEADAAWHKAGARLDGERKLRGVRFGRSRRAAE